MKYQSLLLLLWTLTAFVICQQGKPEISAIKTANGIKLLCPNFHVGRTGDTTSNSTLDLEYKDENTGEFTCIEPDSKAPLDSKVYVKFRTCDNCIEVDPAALTGLVVGNVVATVVVAVTVYFIALQRRTAQDTSNEKSYDNPRVVPNERSSRAPNEHYQSLRPRNVQKRDEYDQLKSTRKQKAETPTAPPLPPT